MTPLQIAGLQRWYESRQGRYALKELQQTVQSMSADIFGYYALEIGLLAEWPDFLCESRIGMHVKMSADLRATDAEIIADAEALPIAVDNVDLVVGWHLLDYTQSPHQVLREIDRVLVPEGHCILIGFNPFSCRGLHLFWRRLYQRAGPSMYSGFRIRDWFSILGFEIIETRTLGFRPGLGSERVFNRFAGLEQLGKRYQLALGNLQVIHVRKQVAKMTPLKTSRQVRPILKPSVAVNSSAGRALPVLPFKQKQGSKRRDHE